MAIRGLSRNPLFTAVSVLCIAIGSGAATTVFSAVNALLLRPLPGVGGPESLVRIERVRPDGEGGYVSSSYPYYARLRANVRALTGLAAYGKAPLSVGTASEGFAVSGNLVSGNYFAVLGVRPLLGRFFTPDEDRAELTHPVVVVSEQFWRTRLGGDSAAVGRALLVNGSPFTLIGVAPAVFTGLETPIRVDAWVPIMMRSQLRPHGPALSDVSGAWLRLCGRLADGKNMAAAREELVALHAAAAAEAGELVGPDTFGDFRLSSMTALPPDSRRALAFFLGLLLGAAALVLVIGSVNVAALLSARAITRRGEMAMRAALGASRGRLVRQLLTEVLLLFGLGAAGGVALADVAGTMLERSPLLGLGGASMAFELSQDWRVVGFALLSSLLTGLAFGTTPALTATARELAGRVRGGTAAGGRERSLLQNGLIIGQLALSLVLLVVAGLFARALQHGRRIDPGFEVANVATAAFNTDSWGYSEPEGRAFYRALRERVAALSSVSDVSYATRLPLTLSTTSDEVRFDGTGAALSVGLLVVDAGYFAALRLPILRGEPIGPAHDEQAPRVAVINQTLANHLWPGGDAVGRSFSFRDARLLVVGVARDAKYGSLAESPQPFLYVPIAQYWEPAQTLIVRTSLAPAQLAPGISQAVGSIDPALPRPAVTSLGQETAIALLPQRLALVVTAALGILGLFLASAGLYGTISYSTRRRARDIGIRIAFGARQADVLRLVLREGLRSAFIGVAIGVLLAAAATQLLAGFLFGVSPLDPATYALFSALLIAVGFLASWLPARRAAAADPVTTLRSE